MTEEVFKPTITIGVNKRIKAVFLEFPNAKNSDNLLILRYWGKFYDKIFHQVANILGDEYITYQLEKAENIRRTRQTIQNVEQVFLPDSKVARARIERQERMRRQFSKKVGQATLLT